MTGPLAPSEPGCSTLVPLVAAPREGDHAPFVQAVIAIAERPIPSLLGPCRKIVDIETPADTPAGCVRELAVSCGRVTMLSSARRDRPQELPKLPVGVIAFTELVSHFLRDLPGIELSGDDEAKA